MCDWLRNHVLLFCAVPDKLRYTASNTDCSKLVQRMEAIWLYEKLVQMLQPLTRVPVYYPGLDGSAMAKLVIESKLVNKSHQSPFCENHSTRLMGHRWLLYWTMVNDNGYESVVKTASEILSESSYEVFHYQDGQLKESAADVSDDLKDSLVDGRRWIYIPFIYEGLFAHLRIAEPTVDAVGDFRCESMLSVISGGDDILPFHQ